jgi:hypothetical protein
MKENTFTFTARSATNPTKMATFTLHNGSVSVELGNTLAEQLDEVYEKFDEEGEIGSLRTLLRPAATGTMQMLMEPIPLADFDAQLSNNDEFQARAWLRAAGLRLAPLMLTWDHVDNGQGARAFVTELNRRKQAQLSDRDEEAPSGPLDYWVSWVVIGLLMVLTSILLARQWQKRLVNNTE